MKNSIQHPCAKRFTTRLPITQFEHLKAMANPSAYVRSLIEKDMVSVVQHEQQ